MDSEIYQTGVSFSDTARLDRAVRLDRQTRVGILRNPNRIAPPPPHRPPLMGRWMNLRSTRRPKAGQQDRDSADPDSPSTETETRTQTGPLVASDGHEISGIDIDQLMATVAHLGQSAPSRAPIAADVLGPAKTPPGSQSADIYALQTALADLADLSSNDTDLPQPPGRKARFLGALARLLRPGTHRQTD